VPTARRVRRLLCLRLGDRSACSAISAFCWRGASSQPTCSASVSSPLDWNRFGAAQLRQTRAPKRRHPKPIISAEAHRTRYCRSASCCCGGFGWRGSRPLGRSVRAIGLGDRSVRSRFENLLGCRAIAFRLTPIGIPHPVYHRRRKRQKPSILIFGILAEKADIIGMIFIGQRPVWVLNRP
jgi:hypothetical protein